MFNDRPIESAHIREALVGGQRLPRMSRLDLRGNK